MRTTEQLRKAGELLDIELLDHIIIGRHQHVSLKERGLKPAQGRMRMGSVAR